MFVLLDPRLFIYPSKIKQEEDKGDWMRDNTKKKWEIEWLTRKYWTSEKNWCNQERRLKTDLDTNERQGESEINGVTWERGTIREIEGAKETKWKHKVGDGKRELKRDRVKQANFKNKILIFLYMHFDLIWFLLLLLFLLVRNVSVFVS